MTEIKRRMKEINIKFKTPQPYLNNEMYRRPRDNKSWLDTVSDIWSRLKVAEINYAGGPKVLDYGGLVQLSLEPRKQDQFKKCLDEQREILDIELAQHNKEKNLEDDPTFKDIFFYENGLCSMDNGRTPYLSGTCYMLGEEPSAITRVAEQIGEMLAFGDAEEKRCATLLIEVANLNQLDHLGLMELPKYMSTRQVRVRMEENVNRWIGSSKIDIDAKSIEDAVGRYVDNRPYLKHIIGNFREHDSWSIEKETIGIHDIHQNTKEKIYRSPAESEPNLSVLLYVDQDPLVLARVAKYLEKLALHSNKEGRYVRRLLSVAHNAAIRRNIFTSSQE